MRLLTFCLLIICSTCFAQTKPKISVTPAGNGFYVYTSVGMFKGTAVPANGLLFQSPAGVVMLDTPWDIDQTNQLLSWIKANLHQSVLFCIHTHYHDDRVGGIAALQKQGIKSYASVVTNTKAMAEGYPKVSQTFTADTTIYAGKVPVEIYYPGAGHTSDNEVVWFPQQNVLYGGCFIKSTDATDLGNVAEADLKQWPLNIQKLMDRYPNATLIIPGHGEWRNKASMQHTLKLLLDYNSKH